LERRVTFSILINNHNNGPFLRECLESALGQGRPAEEVIVVDDGSTDGSRQILEQGYGTNPKVKIILQANLGQTAAITRGLESATGDILCLLDADDRYKPNYLAELEAHYEARPHVDLTFCRFEPFGEAPYWGNDSFLLFDPKKDYDFGYTALLTYFGNVDWIGHICSTLSLRAFLARKLALREVIDLLNNRVQGEYPLLLAASLAGGRKYHLHQALIDYRHHAQSTTRHAHASVSGKYGWNYYNQVRLNFYKRRSAISDAMKWRLSEEAATIPDPLPEHLQLYRRAFLHALLPEYVDTTLRNLKRVVRRKFGK
jgi:glycosyltransferase involved in cell wall biosynthesis